MLGEYESDSDTNSDAPGYGVQNALRKKSVAEPKAGLSSASELKAGVPTKPPAARTRVSLRRKRRKTEPDSPSFVGSWAASSSEPSASSEDEGAEVATDPKDLEPEEADPIVHEPELVTESFAEVLITEQEPLVFPHSSTKLWQTVDAHTRAITQLRFLPNSGSLLLSSGIDGNIFLWDLRGPLPLKVRGYYGHSQGVKDITFNADGTRFLSCSYDKTILLWDTQTGTILHKRALNAIPNCAIFYPHDEDEFVVGLSNKRIEQISTKSDRPLVVYDHHLGEINSLTVIEGGKRFLSSSDDRSLRIWDWNLNIPAKIIAEPTQQSMPCAVWHPQDQMVALQSMENAVSVIQDRGKFKWVRNKRFQGHKVAGYGIQIALSCDGSLLVSGDALGHVFMWAWKTGKLLRKLNLGLPFTNCVATSPCSPGLVAAGGKTGIIYLCK